MKRNMNQNSLEAYESIKPFITNDEFKIISIISKSSKPMTCEQVATSIEKGPHKISGRFTNLKTNSILEVAGKGKTSGGRSCDTYRINAEGVNAYMANIEGIKAKEESRKELAA